MRHNIDWTNLFFGLFMLAIIIMVIGFPVAFVIHEATTCSSYDDECINKDKPCDQYTVEQYLHGEFPYRCSTKAEDVLQRFSK